ncbi:MAG: DUF1289 domain-containing protein [Sphingomonadales bacterium]|nr:MAG: DUF1289 domain-containing protein [Sphingomonadales bacterium]
MISPCRMLCQLDASGRYCTGCWRHRDEIAAWQSLSEAERLQIMAALPAREAMLRSGTICDWIRSDAA